MSWMPQLTCAALALSLAPGGSLSRPAVMAGAFVPAAPNQVEVSGGGTALDANLQLGSGGYNSRGGRSAASLRRQRVQFGGSHRLHSGAVVGTGGLYARNAYNARQWSNTYVPSSFYRHRQQQLAPTSPEVFHMPSRDPVVVVTPETQAGSGTEAGTAQPSQRDQLSYGLGFFLGQEVTGGLAADGISGNLEMIVRGFAAGLQGEEPNIPKEQLDAVMTAVHEEMERRMVARLLEEDPNYKKIYDENEDAGQAYLNKNGAEEGVTTLSNGIQIRTISSGSEGPSPAASDTVVIRFSATLVDGTEVESGDAEEIRVDSIIEGGAHVLQMMKAGDRWDVAIPPDLGQLS